MTTSLECHCCCWLASPAPSSGMRGARARAKLISHEGAGWGLCEPKVMQIPSGKQCNPEGVSKVGPVSVCDVWPCVDVVMGIVWRCGRRYPRKFDWSCTGLKQLSQYCAHKRKVRVMANPHSWFVDPIEVRGLSLTGVGDQGSCTQEAIRPGDHLCSFEADGGSFGGRVQKCCW